MIPQFKSVWLHMLVCSASVFGVHCQKCWFAVVWRMFPLGQVAFNSAVGANGTDTVNV